MSTKLLKDDGIVWVQNELLSLKKRLENCSPEELVVLQSQIKAFRSLLEADRVEELKEEIEF